MIQKVLRVGSSAAVTIPKRSLEKLGLRIGDRVVVDIERKAVVIKPQRQLSSQDEKIAKLTLSFINRYREDLEILARY